jgi:serine/threonine-protein kinase RsbW
MESVVELRVPALTSHVALVRTATAAICAGANFTVDALDDVQLAVDEACAVVIADAPPDANLDVTWRVRGEDVEIELRCATLTGRPLATNTFAWTVLTALVDRVETDVVEGVRRISLRGHGIGTTV